MPPQRPSTHPNSNVYTIAIITLGSFGFMLWAAAIGVSLMLGFDSINEALIALVNMAYIYCTSRIIYLITTDTFPSPNELILLRKIIALFTAATIAGFGLFISSTGNFAINGSSYLSYGRDGAAFGCSFSFLGSIVVIAIVGVHMKKSSNHVTASGKLVSAPMPIVAQAVPTAGYYVSAGNQQRRLTTYDGPFVAEYAEPFGQGQQPTQYIQEHDQV